MLRLFFASLAVIAFFNTVGLDTISADESFIMETVLVLDEQENPAQAAKVAAEMLLQKMGNTPLKLVIVLESFDGQEDKEQLLTGLTTILPKEIVFGLSTYGSFVESGAADGDTIALLGIGGDGITIRTAMQTELGVSSLKMENAQDEIRSKLHEAGKNLAEKLTPQKNHKLNIVLADAHSPKNGFLVEGIQKVYGQSTPILGGSANKNPGQNQIYYQGKKEQDAAAIIQLSGEFEVSLAGRFANQGETVIQTATDAAQEAINGAKGEQFGMIAFSCAGRKSKLDDIGNELATIKNEYTTGTIFGGFCAGEIGPTDKSVEKTDADYCGSGWCLMLAVFYH